MITWLQNATSKHHRTIFGFLLVIVVVSFVGYGFVGRGDLGLNSELRYMGVDLADARNRQRYYFDCQTFSLGRIQGLTIQQRIAELHLAIVAAQSRFAPHARLPDAQVVPQIAR